MTEDEARTKWCPHAVASHTDPRQIMDGHWLHHCIGSSCMAWRWSDPESEPGVKDALTHAAAGRKLDAIKALRWALPHLSLVAAKDIVEGCAPWPTSGGFCGLAGRPS